MAGNAWDEQQAAWLRMADPLAQQLLLAIYQGHAERVRDLFDAILKSRRDYVAGGSQSQLSVDALDPLMIPLADCPELELRIVNELEAYLGAIYVRDLLGHTPEKVKSTPGVGASKYLQIERLLKRLAPVIEKARQGCVS